jgi:hypothetical protein
MPRSRVGTYALGVRPWLSKPKLYGRPVKKKSRFLKDGGRRGGLGETTEMVTKVLAERGIDVTLHGIAEVASGFTIEDDLRSPRAPLAREGSKVVDSPLGGRLHREHLA